MHTLIVKISFVLFFIFITIPINAQIKMGFQWDADVISSEDTDDAKFTSPPIPSGLYFNLKLQTSKSFQTDFRIGAVLGDYGGFEWGVFPKYAGYKGFYLESSYLRHMNSDAGGHTSGGIKNNIDLLGIGLGFNYSKTVTIELIYYKPIGNSDYYWHYHRGDYSIVRERIKSIIKLGIGVNWTIID